MKASCITAAVLAIFCAATEAQACPKLSGKYQRQDEDGIVYWTITQHACDRVVVENVSYYLGKRNDLESWVYIPDDAPHGDELETSQWIDNKLVIQHGAMAYFFVDAAGNLHMSDGQPYPQCNSSPCDEVAIRMTHH